MMSNLTTKDKASLSFIRDQLMGTAPTPRLRQLWTALLEPEAYHSTARELDGPELASARRWLVVLLDPRAHDLGPSAKCYLTAAAGALEDAARAVNVAADRMLDLLMGETEGAAGELIR